MLFLTEMSNSDDYNAWSDIYDVNENKTRDLERSVALQLLADHQFETLIELGCGTGKNTHWLIDKADHIMALDFSEKMMEKAKNKLVSHKVQFFHRDIDLKWELPKSGVSAISCSLTLEHISNLDHIFKEASFYLKNNGIFYICELHPFKQYAGSKARFEANNKINVLKTYTHNMTDYLLAARKHCFEPKKIDEWFDDKERSEIPRLISFIFEKFC